MRTTIIIFCLLLPAVTSMAAEQTGLAYPCHRAAQSPVIDGDVMGDAAWQSIPSVTGFYVLGGGHTKAKQTRAWICFDAEAIYVAAVCEEPDAAELKPSVPDGGWTWGEDSIEVFLQPGGQTQAYQFGVTTGAAIGSGAGGPDITLCKAAGVIGADSYSVEIRIPFAVFDIPTPVDGDIWHGTVCRNIMTATSGGDKFTCWSPLQSRFLEPENFATITMHTQTLDATAASAISHTLNEPYRQTVLADLKVAAADADRYIRDLQAATEHERFAEDAARLVAGWRDIERINKDAATADVGVIRQVLVGVNELASKSYDLRFHHLLTELVDE